MQSIYTFLLIFLASVASSIEAVRRSAADTTNAFAFNVMDFGARANGQDDDTQAFLKAWGALCGSSNGGQLTLVVPKDRTFLLNRLIFQGPCKPQSVNVKMEGRIIAAKYNNPAWEADKRFWIRFSGVDGLTISGGGVGVIDGQGSDWWKVCEKSDCIRPMALVLDQCKNLQLSGLTSVDSAKNHIIIYLCHNVQVSDVHIRAPAESPNTDGIKIVASTNVNIDDCDIGTGDDCIAILNGVSHIKVTNVLCGPGHGISIGSLGKDGAYDTVENVIIRNCTLKETDNGLRIKTWIGGKGYARKITYEEIKFLESKNPIVITQKYIDTGLSKMNNTVGNSSVQLSDVVYRRVWGTSANKTAINFDCADGRGCSNIVMENVNITSIDQKTNASCNNAHGRATLTNPNVICLSI